MRKTLLVGLGIIVLFPAVSNPTAQKTFGKISIIEFSINRGLEIRYIQDIPQSQSHIEIEGKKFPVFNSKEAAIDFATNMSVKSDYTIVYVRSVSPLENEIIELPK